MIASILGALLIFGLIGAGWSIYRRLPKNGQAIFRGARPATETILRIRMRRAPTDGAQASDIKLYSIDVVAAQHEFLSERRAGLRLEDFLARRMGARPPITAQFDEHGQAVVAVPPGRWWIHAALTSTQGITWRLPVNVSGREQTVELTPENAYTRTRSF